MPGLTNQELQVKELFEVIKKYKAGTLLFPYKAK
jgi:hypothetical protein